MSLSLKGLGWKEFQENIDNINSNLVSPQSGISNAMDKAAQATIVEKARENVWNLFDTSGDFPSRIGTKKINQYRVDIFVDAVYGAVHEFGGTFKVTKKQRRFFWAMYMSSDDTMWKALALSVTYTIPSRPYLRPAIDSEAKNAYQLMSDEIYKIMKRSV